MNSLGSILRDDHHTCDRMFAEAEQATASNDYARAQSEFARFRAATERHFDVEEGVLFPAFERAVGDNLGPTEMMRREHKMMRELLDQMEQALEQRQSAQYLEHCETMLVLLQQHNFKEENVLYPMIEQTVGRQQDSFLTQLREAGIG